MRRIDELHLEYPYAGSRILRDLLGPEGVAALAWRLSITLDIAFGIEAVEKAMRRHSKPEARSSSQLSWAKVIQNATSNGPRPNISKVHSPCHRDHDGHCAVKLAGLHK